MTEINTTHAPPGWGDDDLTKFLDIVRHNQFATFATEGPAIKKLIAVDGLFLRASKDWVNPKSATVADLLLRCHSAFRAAVGLAMTGQPETFTVCRAMLEYAAYTVHIDRNPDLEAVWWGRHKDEASMKQQREAFLHGKVSKSVKEANRDAGQRFEKLYQRAIDHGAHPNQRAVTSNRKIMQEPGLVRVQAILLHADGPALDNALKNTAQCGMVSLELLQVALNSRFELLGINAAMLELRDGL
jgi:hypothetical protein